MAYMPHLHKNGNPGAGSSHGIPPGSAAKLWPRCDGIPTESVHKLRSAVAMVSPRHLPAAAATASPWRVQQNSGLGQLQLQWHPHRICTQAQVCSYDRIPTESAGCSCHGIPTAAAAKLWPRSAAAAMASPPHLHKQTYVLQIRWHPHCICRLQLAMASPQQLHQNLAEDEHANFAASTR